MEQENTKKVKDPDIPVEKRSGLNMFDEEKAELSMRCWNPNELNLISFEKLVILYGEELIMDLDECLQ